MSKNSCGGRRALSRSCCTPLCQFTPLLLSLALSPASTPLPLFIELPVPCVPRPPPLPSASFHVVAFRIVRLPSANPTASRTPRRGEWSGAYPERIEELGNPLHQLLRLHDLGRNSRVDFRIFILKLALHSILILCHSSRSNLREFPREGECATISKSLQGKCNRVVFRIYFD